MSIITQINQTKFVIFDSDGCLIEEGKPLPFAIKLTKLLKSKNKKIVIFTNNSTKHPQDLYKLYQSLGFQIDEVLCSSFLTMKYCHEQQIKSVFIVGEKGLEKIFTENNFIISKQKADAVIVGMDRNLTYEKLAIATRLIRSGSRFIATNPDKTFPTPRGQEPGAGTMIAALIASTDQSPEIILGKPNKWGFEFLMSKYQLNPDELLMIGDRYETDIVGALNAKVPALIVNTGIAATRSNPSSYNGGPEVPVIQNFEELIDKL